MPVTSQHDHNTAQHTLEGIISSDDIYQLFNFNVDLYSDVGDAMGVIIDLKNVKRFSVGSLCALQNMTSKFVTKTPTAIVGNKDGFLLMFSQSVVALA